MTDQIENPAEEGTVTEQVKTEKTFTQEEVNKVVAERLKREKEQAKKQVEDVSSEKLQLEEIIKGYEERFEKLLAPQLADIPDEFKPLVDKLTVLEKLEWLASRNTSKTDKKGVPVTPKKSEIEVEKPRKKLGNII